MDGITTTRKIGGSFIVTIPKNIVDMESIQEGEKVRVSIEKIKETGFGLFKGIGEFTSRDRKEMWRKRVWR